MSDVEINRKKSKTMDIGYYNKGEGTALNAAFVIKSCLAEGNQDVPPENLPVITSLSSNVPVSEAQGYSIILSEQGLSSGTYLCEVAVKCEKDCPTWLESEYYEVKQFALKVVA